MSVDVFGSSRGAAGYRAYAKQRLRQRSELIRVSPLSPIVLTGGNIHFMKLPNIVASDVYFAHVFVWYTYAMGFHVRLS